MNSTLKPADLGKLSAFAAELRAAPDTILTYDFAGRGIVIAAGGSTMFTNAYVLAHVLRRSLGCTLPVEVWHLGPAEMSPAMADLLSELDVTTIDAEPVIARTGAGIRDGWQLKPFAMLASRFAEVLLLDADQVPVTDPAACFDWPEYREAGAVFWPDIVDLRASNPIWAAMGLPPRELASIEGGQVLVDKRRHLRALTATVRLNTAAELVYQLVYGDKDTFLFGWGLADAAFAMVPHRPFRDDRVLVQRDFSGRPLFQHRTNAKWRYGGSQFKIESFVHEEACLAALALLEQRWNGQVFHAPDRSVASRHAEAELVAAGPLTLEIGTEERLALELRPFGEIGDGRSLDRQNWWCEEQNGRLILNLGRVEGAAFRFERHDAGLWRGRRLRPPETSAGLFRRLATKHEEGETPGLVDALLRVARFGWPGEEDDGLTAALVLIARADPGILTRLRHMVATAAPDRRAALEQLAAAVEAGAVSHRTDLKVDRAVLLNGYRRPAGDGLS